MTGIRPCQVGEGKIPKRDMIKFTHRYGCIFSCAWLPPADVMLLGFMNAEGGSLKKIVALEETAKIAFSGLGTLAMSLLDTMG